jgi:hypothetical protein
MVGDCSEEDQKLIPDSDQRQADSFGTGGQFLLCIHPGGRQAKMTANASIKRCQPATLIINLKLKWAATHDDTYLLLLTLDDTTSPRSLTGAGPFDFRYAMKCVMRTLD